ncbi:MAG: baseplate J/gp47 family protein [Allosphingosinicella sp.]|uniref:baseplate assembly protein n=1 Tax=Allosphingosinicella sp. TaxID=2823234 RepID=UPI0039207525
MPEYVSSSTAVDLSRLPAPAVVEQLSFEQIYAAGLARLLELKPDFDATVESDPAVKLLQVFAYRELLLRQEANDRLRQVMVAYATGSNLDQLGALFGVARLVVRPADPQAGIEEQLETDESLRERIVLAPESYSVAGPELAYIFHAKTAHPAVLDASCVSPAPGEVVVSVLSRHGDGAAPPEVLGAVEARVNARDVRPLTDHVTVQSAEIIPFAIKASIHTFTGPDVTVVAAEARRRLEAYIDESRKLGRDVTISSIDAALTAPGVQRVERETPLAHIVCSPFQAAHCTSIEIEHGGYED